MAKKKKKDYTVPIILGGAALTLGAAWYFRRRLPYYPQQYRPGYSPYVNTGLPSTYYNPSSNTNWFNLPSGSGSGSSGSSWFSPSGSSSGSIESVLQSYGSQAGSYGGGSSGSSWFDLGTYSGSSNMPRGLRNKNPLNVIISSSAWQGKVPVSQNTDGKFEQFYDIIKGWRAGIKNAKAWHDRGKNTIRSLVSVWAPAGSGEGNNPTSYAQRVSSKTGINMDAVLPWSSSIMIPIFREMAVVENGESWRSSIKDNDIYAAWQIQ